MPLFVTGTLQLPTNGQALYAEEIELDTSSEVEWFGTATLTEVT